MEISGFYALVSKLAGRAANDGPSTGQSKTKTKTMTTTTDNE